MLSQLQEPVRHGLRADCGPAEAWEHGRQIVTTAEAVFELGEQAWRMLLADLAGGAGDRALDVAEHRAHPLEGAIEHVPPASSDDALVRATAAAMPRKHP